MSNSLLREARNRRPSSFLLLPLFLCAASSGLAESPASPEHRERALVVRRVVVQAAREVGAPQTGNAARELLEAGLAGRIVQALGDGANEYLSAELFPHNVGAHVDFEDGATGQGFRRTVFRRDFHHNGIRLLIHRSREGSGYEMETYQIGGGIGVRMDSVRIGEASLALAPAVQLMSVRPRLGETFTTTPDGVHPGSGNRMTWSCRTVAIELLDLEDGSVVPSVAVQVEVEDAVDGTRLASYRVWYGDNMSIARRRGELFGVSVDELSLSTSGRSSPPCRPA
jgi:hypothetical protein